MALISTFVHSRAEQDLRHNSLGRTAFYEKDFLPREPGIYTGTHMYRSLSDVLKQEHIIRDLRSLNR